MLESVRKALSFPFRGNGKSKTDVLELLKQPKIRPQFLDRPEPEELCEVPPQKKILCVDMADVEKYGCPYCRYFASYALIQRDGMRVARCRDETCSLLFVSLDNASGVWFTPFPVLGQTLLSEIHPHEGNLARKERVGDGQKDGMEYFRPHLVQDHSKGFTCFVCRGKTSLYGHSMPVRLWSEQSKERVIPMFAPGSARAVGMETVGAYTADECLIAIESCMWHIRQLHCLHWSTTYTKKHGGWVNESLIKEVVASDGNIKRWCK